MFLSHKYYIKIRLKYCQLKFSAKPILFTCAMNCIDNCQLTCVKVMQNLFIPENFNHAIVSNNFSSRSQWHNISINCLVGGFSPPASMIDEKIF